MPLDAGPDRLREVLAPLQGLALTPETWERDVLPRRLGSYDRTWLDRLCAAGEVVWTGAGSGSGRGGRVALYFREDAPFLGPPQEPSERRPRRAARTTRCASGSRAAPRSGRTCSSTSTSRRSTCATRCGTWCGRARSRTTRSHRCARGACRLRRRSTRAGGAGRFGSRRSGSQPQLQGRWSLTSRLFEPRPSEKERAQARAELLLERHGLVARETVVGGAGPGRVRERVRGAVGARDARLGAARVLRRGPRRRAVRALRGGRAAAHPSRGRAAARRAGGPGPGQPLRRGAAVAAARRAGAAPGTRARRLRRDARRARRSLRRGGRPRAGVARRPSGGVAAGGARRARGVRALAAARCGASGSSAGTASRCWARRSRSCSSERGFRSGPAPPDADGVSRQSPSATSITAPRAGPTRRC